MGRVKNIGVKTMGDDILKEHAEKFSEDFERNKKILEEIKTIKSKKIRNILAGYITNEMKKIKKSGL